MIDHLKNIGFLKALFFLALLSPLDLTFLNRGFYNDGSQEVSIEHFMEKTLQLSVWFCIYIIAFYVLIKKISLIYNRLLKNNLIGSTLVGLLFVSLTVTLAVDEFSLRALDVYLWVSLLLIMALILALDSNEAWGNLLNYIYSVLIWLTVTNLLAIFLFPEIGLDDDGRYAGIMSSSNSFGRTQMLLLIFLLAKLLLGEFSRIKLVIYLTVIPIPTYLLILSGSVSSIFSIVFVFLVMAVRAVNVRSLAVTVPFAIVFAFIMYIIIMIVGVDYATNLLGRDATLTGRTSAWIYGVNAGSEGGYFGHGLADTRSVLHSSGIPSTNFHNNFIELFFRTGPVGLAFHIILVGNLFYKSTSHFRFITNTSVALFMFLAVFIVGFTQSPVFSVRSFESGIYWILIFMLMFRVKIPRSVNYKADFR